MKKIIIHSKEGKELKGAALFFLIFGNIVMGNSLPYIRSSIMQDQRAIQICKVSGITFIACLFAFFLFRGLAVIIELSIQRNILSSLNIKLYEDEEESVLDRESGKQ